jgi:hypothetical protein
LKANHAPAHLRHGLYLAAMERFDEVSAEIKLRWLLCHPRRSEDRRARRRKENEKLPSAGQARCWTHPGKTERGEGYAVLTPDLSGGVVKVWPEPFNKLEILEGWEAQFAAARNQSLGERPFEGIFESPTAFLTLGCRVTIGTKLEHLRGVTLPGCDGKNMT